MTAVRIVSRIGTSAQTPQLRPGEFGYDTDTKNARIGDDTSSPPKIITDKSETFDLSNLKELTLSEEVLEVLAKRGVDGWTPVITTEANGDRELLLIKDWVGGAGDKPEFPVYVSNTGFTTNPALATNVRGKKGSDASGPVISFSIENGNLMMNVLNQDDTMGPITGSIDDDGHLIIEYAAINGTTIHTDLGKILVRARGEYQGGIYYHSLDEVSYNNKLYRVKTDSDPVINILPIDTNHWTLVYSYALGGTYSVQVDNLSDRDAYDTEDEGFSVLVSDNGDGRAAVYMRGSGIGDWVGPAYFTGRDGLVWIDTGWALDAQYQRNQALEHDGTSYRALYEHIAAPETEPGTGVDWETVWQVVALGSDVADVSTVAGIAAEIVTVAAISTEVQAVASVAVDVQTLAPAVGDVQTAVANLPDIQAAPQAASDAADARDASQAYATGTEPGGPGTKSAREHALDAANSATAAQNATLIGYSVSIYNENGIESGGYYAERRATSPSVQTDIYAEIINGDPGSEASIIVMVGGVAVHGPVLVEQDTPVAIDDLSIAVTSTDDLSFMVTASAGVRELFVKLYGAVA